jgi:6-phosphogluconolactonase
MSADWFDLTVAADRAALARTAADRFSEAARQAIDRRGEFAVALSGGSTPRDLHRLLSSPEYRDQVEWGCLHVFWGDERGVSPDDHRSNYRMARETLLDLVPIPIEQVYRPLSERLCVPSVSAAYAEQIRAVLPANPAGVPEFDLILLGLGDDGHTASLLPGDPLVHERELLVAWTNHEREGTSRVTFTAPLLQAARETLVLVAGPEKAEALREVLHGPDRVEKYPAQLLRQAIGRVTVLADRDAARLS